MFSYLGIWKGSCFLLRSTSLHMDTKYTSGGPDTISFLFSVTLRVNAPQVLARP